MAVGLRPAAMREALRAAKTPSAPRLTVCVRAFVRVHVYVRVCGHLITSQQDFVGDICRFGANLLNLSLLAAR